MKDRKHAYRLALPNISNLYPNIMPMVSFWYLEAMVFGELHIFLVATGFLQICVISALETSEVRLKESSEEYKF